MNLQGYLALPAVGVLIGGAIGAWRTLPELWQSAVQHFAAGVVFAAIASEIVPDVLRAGSPITSIAGFLMGVALMFCLKVLADRLERRDSTAAAYPLGLLTAVAVDCVVDGVVVGAGFANGIRQGLLISGSLTLEMLFLGLATAATIKGGGGRWMGIMGVCIGLGALLVASALVGLFLLAGQPTAVLNGFLAFGSAALLYLVTEELLVRAHDLGETRAVTALFFLGFLVVFSFELLMVPVAS